MPLQKFKIYLVLIFSILLTTGCLTPGSSKKTEMEKEVILLKIKNYETLLSDLQNKSLAKGTNKETVRQKYGEPDDIFSSGSTMGSFEHWTYERIDPKNTPELWHPIRLYFDNSKLIDWKY